MDPPATARAVAEKWVPRCPSGLPGAILRVLARPLGGLPGPWSTLGSTWDGLGGLQWYWGAPEVLYIKMGFLGGVPP